MIKILITGANSFIGKNFIKYSRHRVVEEVSLVNTHPDTIDFSKYDIVLHLAAIVHESKKIPENRYFAINRDLCLQVAEKAKKAGVKQFIFLSTFKVYGDSIPIGELRDEDSVCFPTDAYGKSKLEAENDLRKLNDSAFTVSIVRTPLVYGEGVKANMLRLVKIVEKFSLLPFGNIKNKRNFTYIENLVGFIDQIIISRASGIFITMDDNAVSTTQLVNFIAKSLGKKVKLFTLPVIVVRIISCMAPRAFNSLFGSLVINNGKTKSRLNYKPPFSTEDGIKIMIQSYLNEESH